MCLEISYWRPSTSLYVKGEKTALRREAGASDRNATLQRIPGSGDGRQAACTNQLNPSIHRRKDPLRKWVLFPTKRDSLQKFQSVCMTVKTTWSFTGRATCELMKDAAGTGS